VIRCLERGQTALAVMWVGCLWVVSSVVFPCKHVFSEESDGSAENRSGKTLNSGYELWGLA
jgi:hypothetical protein